MSFPLRFQIAVLEDQKKVGEKKVEDETKTSETDQAPATARPPTTSDEVLGKPAVSDDLKEETEVTFFSSY